MASMWIGLEKVKTSEKNGSPCAEPQNVVTLAPFAVAPRLSFGRVVVGTAKSIELIVRNPNEHNRRVFLNKTPKDDFTVDRNNFTVAGGQDETVSVTWNPTNEGNRREILTFSVEHNFCPQIVVLGEAYVPKRRLKATQRHSVLRPPKVPIQRCSNSDNRRAMKDLATSTRTLTKENVSKAIAPLHRPLGVFPTDERFPVTCYRRQTFVLSGSNRENVAAPYVCRASNATSSRSEVEASDHNKAESDFAFGSIDDLQEYFSEDSLEESSKAPPPSCSVVESNVANSKKIENQRSTLSTMFKGGACSHLSSDESSSQRCCSTEIKNKPLPELNLNLSPVESRKRLFCSPRAPSDRRKCVESTRSGIAEETYQIFPLMNLVAEVPTSSKNRVTRRSNFTFDAKRRRYEESDSN